MNGDETLLRAAAVIVAAGQGTRLGQAVPKAFVELCGRCLLARSVDALQGAPAVQLLVLVAPPADLERARAVVAPRVRPGVSWQVVAGGVERQDSVRRGLAVVPETCDVIAVHDAARPLVSPASVSACIEAAAEKGAATLAVPASDTVKEVAPDGRVVRTLDRTRLWLVQTPQAFRCAVLRDAHARAAADGIVATDDASLVERYGGAVWVVPGERTNIKITAPDDLAWAEWWLGVAGDPR